MGDKAGKTDGHADAIAAYTFYGFQCRCANSPTFVSGHPQNDCCGTSCTRVTLPEPASTEHQKALQELEDRLGDAEDIAREVTTYCSYVICAGIDMTSAEAAKKLNATWCKEINEQILNEAGLNARAGREVYGFGRSRVAYLVIRVEEV